MMPIPFDITLTCKVKAGIRKFFKLENEKLMFDSGFFLLLLLFELETRTCLLNTECMFFLLGRFHFGCIENRELKVSKMCRLHTEGNENKLIIVLIFVVNQEMTYVCS
jgi:hypothetical protein